MTKPHYGSLRTVLKENMRNARFLAREIKGTLDRFGPQVHPNPARRLASLSDKTFQRLESIALDIASQDPGLHEGHVAALALRPLFVEPSREKADRFARNQYAATKRLLILQGIDNPGISEIAFASAYEAVANATVSGMEDSALAARLTLEIRNARSVTAPPVLVDARNGERRDANLFIACVLGLAMLVASTAEDLGADEGIHDAACVAVDIRYEDMVKAAHDAEPEAALAAVFASVARHLP